ncbi:glycosyltransferase family 2 protein [Candidatus Daviesbacteria bacterium]|nr:glycosyltransferase family 2 protein [Candidatus Daviesbacteria bacterium]MBI2334792.1 glycosyltransferase family 2 protein [Candidatus Daviesbacteria bacterium]
MKKLSIVLAVYNEEENLRQCLESVKDLAWEIVVVDGGSTDRTCQVAKDFGARIIDTDNPPLFHINKNKAIDAAKGEWILQLDADEIVTKDLTAEIKEAIEEPFINGYWIPRKNFFLGRFLKKGGQYPDYTLRLYKKGKGRLPAKDVHEQALVQGQTGFLKADLLHVRDKTFAYYLEGFNRYTDLLALQLQAAGFKNNFFAFVNFLFFKPFFWFIKAYFRHLGLMDGFPGFIFALFSALRFPVSYIKYRIKNTK